MSIVGKPGVATHVPKRSEERRRRHKRDVDKAPGAAAVTIPNPHPQWHPIARRWFASLAESGQSRYYEPSDWAAAEYVAESMSRNLKQGQRFSATLFASIVSAMNELLTTEGARRRVRIELERHPGGEHPAGVTALNEYRDMLE